MDQAKGNGTESGPAAERTSSWRGSLSETEGAGLDGRGRHAERPGQIPKVGWRDILKRTLYGLSEDNGSAIAAGMAFYAFLSIPALLTALVSIYGLVANPADVGHEVSGLKTMVPSDALNIIQDQLTRVTSQTGGALTLTLVLSFLFALWSGSNSIKALISALNIANGEEEKRGFLRYNVMSLLMTLAAVVGMGVAIGLVVVVSGWVDRLDVSQSMKSWITILRWPVLAGFALIGLAAAYRYLPSRREPKWRWVSWGAVSATLLWMGASALFSWYAGGFGNYNKTYGSLSAIVVLLMWFYISAYAVLFGAKLNAEMEHQTARDSTPGPEKQMGQRGARMADTLGKAA